MSEYACKEDVFMGKSGTKMTDDMMAVLREKKIINLSPCQILIMPEEFISQSTLAESYISSEEIM